MNITITFPVQSPPPPPPPPPPSPRLFVGWRGRHAETEGGRKPAYVGAPAVIPAMENDLAVPLTADIQYASYDLAVHFCSAVTRERWRSPLHNHAFAMTNKGAGYDYGTVLRDYINNRDVLAVDGQGKPALPKYDKTRTFQGSFITGKLDGGVIWCTPGVDGIDANNFVYKPGTPEAEETLKWIIENAFYSIAVGTGNPPYHVRSQWGSGCLIAFLFILKQTVGFDARFFAPWESKELPDPIATYTPV